MPEMGIGLKSNAVNLETLYSVRSQISTLVHGTLAPRSQNKVSQEYESLQTT